MGADALAKCLFASSCSPAESPHNLLKLLVQMGSYVLQGILHLHSHVPPVLHRDLKSPNMLVDRDWRVKVTDFNLSCLQTEATSGTVHSLQASNPRWLAPEVIACVLFCIVMM